MHHYYIDLIASVRTLIQNCETICDLRKVVINSISKQFDKIFIVCDTYLEFSIKNNEKMSGIKGEKYSCQSRLLSVQTLKFLTIFVVSFIVLQKIKNVYLN